MHRQVKVYIAVENRSRRVDVNWLPIEASPVSQALRIVYAVDRPRKRLKIVAVGHRRRIYEDVTAHLGRKS